MYCPFRRAKDNSCRQNFCLIFFVIFAALKGTHEASYAYLNTVIEALTRKLKNISLFREQEQAWNASWHLTGTSASPEFVRVGCLYQMKAKYWHCQEEVGALTLPCRFFVDFTVCQKITKPMKIPPNRAERGVLHEMGLKMLRVTFS